ncbi:MAG TPA: choice-of-anchor J domain-containing protein [Flavobacteriaceae bacterium]|nr:choice-of-anchor J domain-containing protein [Flavobacteriaceae bacterium]
MKKIIFLIAFCMSGFWMNAQTTYNLDWYMGVSMADASLEIEVGDTVIWTFTDGPPHSVTSDVGSSESFDSTTLPSGSTYSYTFTTAGINPYHCEVHPSMMGVITVSAGGPQISTIEVTGYNEDIVANGTGPMASSTSMAADADSFCLLSEDWILNAGDTPITVGLPANGQIVSPDVAGLVYQIPTAAAPYEGNNSLRLDLAGGGNGTVTLDSPAAYSSLYFLVFAGNGNAFVDVTVNFADATAETFTGNTVPDWFMGGLPVEILGFGRGDRDNNNVETPLDNPKLYRLQLDISVPNQSKDISSITFDLTNAAGDDVVFNLMAVNGREATSCLPPFDIVVSNILTNSADISWDTTAGVTEWEIEYGPIGFALGTGTIVSDTNGVPGETLTGLTAATEYDVYVTAICGAGNESAPVGPISFDTGCVTVSAGFTEGFESTNVGDITTCWSIINQGGPDAWAVSDIGPNAYDGTKVMYIAWDSNPAHDDYLITPQIAVTPGVTDRFIFHSSGNSTVFEEIFNVLVSTTGTDEADFTLIDGPITAAQSGWSEHEYNLSPYAGQNIYIAIQAVSNNQLQLYIDGVVLNALPSCPEPINLTAENIMPNSADLAWLETGSATSWDVEWGPAGFAPTGTPTDAAVGNPYPISGLSPGASYEFYVRGDCGGGDSSDWAGPYLFTTNCVLITAGFTEGFESTPVGDVTTCWSIINQGGPDAWAVSDVGANAYDGTKVMFISWDSNPGHDDYLISPQMSVISGVTDRFRFQAWGNSTFYQETFNVFVSTTGTDLTDFTLIDGPVTASQTDWVEYEYNLSAYAGQDIYIAIQIVSDNQLQLYIDGVVLDALPSCPKPISLTAENITTNSADLAWTETSSATSWDVEWGLAGFAPTGTPTDAGVGNPFPLSSLSPGTNYEFYVRGDCGGGDYSEWAGPYLFTTNCALVTTGFTEGFEFTDVGDVTNCWSIINQGGPDAWEVSDVGANAYDGTKVMYISWDSNPGHDDYLITPHISVISGVTDRFTFFSSSNSTFYNEVFNVLVSTTGTDAADFTLIDGPITSPQTGYAEHLYNLSAYAGQDIYIAIQVISDNQLHLYIDGVVLDALPSCPKPNSLNAENITTDGADLSWNETGSATMWDIELGPAGFAPTGVPTNEDVTNPYPATGLLSGTDYEYYVRSDCGGGDTSVWVGPYAFQTNFTCGDTFFDTGGATGSYENNANETWTISPDIPGYLVTAIFTSFEVEANWDALYVYDGPDATYPQIASFNPPTNSGFPAGGYYGTDVPGPFTSTHPSGALTFVFMSEGSGIQDGWVANIICNPPPTCPTPSDLGATVTTTTADLSWVENGSATTWEIEYGFDDFAPTGVATETATSNPFQITNLQPGADYEFYIRADCGGGDLSNWTGPFGFTMLCEDVYTPDYLEDFTFFPNCWQEADAGMPEDGPLGLGSGPWFADEFLNTGDNISASIYIYNQNQIGWLISPDIDLTGGNYELAYTAAITDYFNSNPPEGNGMGSDDVINVMISEDDGATWDILKTYNQNGFPSFTGDNEIIQLTGYTGVVQIAFWATGGTVDDSEAYDVFIDDFEVRTSTVTCAEPINLTVTQITTEEATLSWEEVGNATGYTWYVFEAGADPETATPIATGTTTGVLSAVATGLTANTEYDFYVVADCGATDGLSEMAGPIPFETEELGIENHLFEGFNYYPNPVNNQLSLESTKQIEEVVIFNLLGQEVIHLQPNTLNPVLKLSNLQAGTYLMKVSIDDVSQVFTIVKE